MRRQKRSIVFFTYSFPFLYLCLYAFFLASFSSSASSSEIFVLLSLS